MNPYSHRLRALNRQRGPRAEVPTAVVDGTMAAIRLYDSIDSWGEWWGVSAREFAEVLDGLPAGTTEIRLHINSSGGEVFEAIAMANLLRQHRARVVAVVDGIAASAASFIAVSADETVMAPHSELMIHDAWGACVGNAADMTSMAATLDGLSQNIASMYAAKAGGDVDAWRAAMTAETWYAADEAVAAGLADRVGDATEEQPANRLDLSLFNFAGRDDAPAPDLAAPTASDPVSHPGDEQEQTEQPVVRAPLTHLFA